MAIDICDFWDAGGDLRVRNRQLGAGHLSGHVRSAAEQDFVNIERPSNTCRLSFSLSSSIRTSGCTLGLFVARPGQPWLNSRSPLAVVSLPVAIANITFFLLSKVWASCRSHPLIPASSKVHKGVRQRLAQRFRHLQDDRDRRYHEQGQFPDVLQQPQVGHGAPVLYGCLRLATALPCRLERLWEPLSGNNILQIAGLNSFVQLFHCPFPWLG